MGKKQKGAKGRTLCSINKDCYFGEECLVKLSKLKMGFVHGPLAGKTLE